MLVVNRSSDWRPFSFSPHFKKGATPKIVKSLLKMQKFEITKTTVELKNQNNSKRAPPKIDGNDNGIENGLRPEF